MHNITIEGVNLTLRGSGIPGLAACGQIGAVFARPLTGRRAKNVTKGLYGVNALGDGENTALLRFIDLGKLNTNL